MTLHVPGSATALASPATIRPGERNATVTYMAQATSSHQLASGIQHRPADWEVMVPSRF